MNLAANLRNFSGFRLFFLLGNTSNKQIQPKPQRANTSQLPLLFHNYYQELGLFFWLHLLFEVKKMVNLGRTSRNPEDIIKHLEELKAEGITVSADIPSYNPKIKDRITTENKIQSLPNSKTSGEVEYVLLFILYRIV